MREETLARHRLLDWLAAKIHHRVILVLADAEIVLHDIDPTPLPRMVEWVEHVAARRSIPLSVRATTDRRDALDGERLRQLRRRAWIPRIVRPIGLPQMHLSVDDGALARGLRQRSGEVLVAGAGQVRRLVVGETAGIVVPELTPEDVAEQLDAILDPTVTEPMPVGYSAN